MTTLSKDVYKKVDPKGWTDGKTIGDRLTMKVRLNPATSFTGLD